MGKCQNDLGTQAVTQASTAASAAFFWGVADWGFLNLTCNTFVTMHHATPRTPKKGCGNGYVPRVGGSEGGQREARGRLRGGGWGGWIGGVSAEFYTTPRPAPSHWWGHIGEMNWGPRCPSSLVPYPGTGKGRSTHGQPLSTHGTPLSTHGWYTTRVPIPGYHGVPTRPHISSPHRPLAFHTGTPRDALIEEMLTPFSPLAEGDRRRQQYIALIEQDKKARDALAVGRRFHSLAAAELAVKTASRVSAAQTLFWCCRLRPICTACCRGLPSPLPPPPQ